MKSVYSAVQTWSLNKAVCASYLKVLMYCTKGLFLYMNLYEIYETTNVRQQLTEKKLRLSLFPSPQPSKKKAKPENISH
jgi:hypothetical protein